MAVTAPQVIAPLASVELARTKLTSPPGALRHLGTKTAANASLPINPQATPTLSPTTPMAPPTSAFGRSIRYLGDHLDKLDCMQRRQCTL